MLTTYEWINFHAEIDFLYKQSLVTDWWKNFFWGELLDASSIHRPTEVAAILSMIDEQNEKSLGTTT